MNRILEFRSGYLDALYTDILSATQVMASQPTSHYPTVLQISRYHNDPTFSATTGHNNHSGASSAAKYRLEVHEPLPKQGLASSSVPMIL